MRSYRVDPIHHCVLVAIPRRVGTHCNASLRQCVSTAIRPYGHATLRAEIDESAWESLYSTVSRPFPVPETGKIAVKAINHYGDEVLKVIEIPS